MPDPACCGCLPGGRIGLSGRIVERDAHVHSYTRHTVYIVDRDDAVRDSLSVFLEIEGFATQVFAACAEFHSIERRPANSCLLLDFQLPRHGGDECLACLVRHVSRLPVIVMSGAARHTEARSLRAGASAFLEKPLNSDDLIGALRKVFG